MVSLSFTDSHRTVIGEFHPLYYLDFRCLPWFGCWKVLGASSAPVGMVAEILCAVVISWQLVVHVVFMCVLWGDHNLVFQRLSTHSGICAIFCFRDVNANSGLI